MIESQCREFLVDVEKQKIKRRPKIFQKVKLNVRVIEQAVNGNEPSEQLHYVGDSPFDAGASIGGLLKADDESLAITFTKNGVGGPKFTREFFGGYLAGLKQDNPNI